MKPSDDPRLDDAQWIAAQLLTRCIEVLAKELHVGKSTLVDHMRRLHVPAHQDCIYCSKHIGSSIYVHQRICPQNPMLFVALRDALDCGTGAIISPNYYDNRAALLDLPNKHVLEGVFDSWEACAVFFGLRPEIARKTKVMSERRSFKTIDREIAAELQISRAQLEAAREYAPFKGWVHRVDGATVEFDANKNEYIARGGSVTYMLR